MNTTISLKKGSEIRRIGIEALIKALGPVGMARFMEEYDNGGSGDYTAEKYQQPDLTIDDIINELHNEKVSEYTKP